MQPWPGTTPRQPNWSSCFQTGQSRIISTKAISFAYQGYNTQLANALSGANTIQGSGQIIGLGQLINLGTILANQPTGLVIQSTVATSDNLGTLQATSGATLSLDGTTTNEGTVQADAGSGIGLDYTQNSGLNIIAAGANVSTVTPYTQAGGSTTINPGGSLTAPAFSQTAGITTVDGTLTAGPVTIAGILLGNGTVSGPVTSSGTVMPGDAPAPGQLDVT